MSCLDRVLVRQVGTFPKLSLWLASLDGCVCDIEQKMASVTSAIYVLISFNLVLHLVVGVVLHGLAGSCCRDAA